MEALLIPKQSESGMKEGERKTAGVSGFPGLFTS